MQTVCSNVLFHPTKQENHFFSKEFENLSSCLSQADALALAPLPRLHSLFIRRIAPILAPKAHCETWFDSWFERKPAIVVNDDTPQNKISTVQ